MANLFLVIASAVLSGLSFYSPPFSFLIWFSLAPFLYIIGRAKKDRLLYGFFFGFFFFLTVLFWVVYVTALGVFALLTYLSLYLVLFSLAAKYLLNKPLAIVSLGCLWVVLELLKENVWCGLSWGNLGYSQYRNLYIIQIADLFGVKFISFIIIAVNVLIYELTFKYKKFVWKKILFVLFLITACLTYSVFRLHGLRSNSSVSLSLVQPNILQEVKHNSELRGQIIEKLKNLSERVKTDSLIIYPEAAWPEITGESDFNRLKDFAGHLKKDILIGAVIFEKGRFFNTALLMTKEAGFIDIYRKIKIVPFGEYVPLREYLSFVSVLNSLGDITRGDEYTIFSYRDKKFGVLICFEDIFPLFVSRFAKNSDFLINITDDSWFAGEPEASQHLGVMVLRAVENRISIARCANTGISGWVSFNGEIHTLNDSGREVFFENILQFNLPLNNKRSLYNNWQELFPFFCLLMLFICLVKK
jgi:apolipoprotein N-acyltransferase